MDTALSDNVWHFLFSGTYEAKVHMTNGKFTDKLEDVASDEFKKEQEEFCSKVGNRTGLVSGL